MPRYKLTLEYDGAGFVGWQHQANGPSVQETVETAIERFCGEHVRVYAAGRTDAGVHALGQVIHFDLAKVTPPGTVRDAINYHLKQVRVAVLSAERVPAKFDARRSARAKLYLYRIVNRRSPLALERGRAWRVGRPLDAVAMHDAAQLLVGRHDFTSFRSSHCQARSPVRTLDALAVDQVETEVRITARARSFLHHQVRNIAGTLKLVGEGKWTGTDIRRALEARDRSAGGPTAPPEGLYLVEIHY